MSWEIKHGDVREVCRQLDGQKFHAVLCDPPYGLEFMGKEFDTFKVSKFDPSFLNWFAGFTDGEGCFSIHRKPQDTFDCQFSISLRADDRPILEQIQRMLGFGTVATQTPSDDSKNPKARYCVSAKADCAKLREIFRAFPLRAKKARDFEIWSDGLDAWLNHEKGDWAEMKEYREALMSSRAYESGGVRVNPFQVAVTRWGKALLPLLYPGAVVLMFGGTRTWHRLACGMEDAGFEMWDTLMWLYGSGFPKAQDLSKLIDAKNGDERDKVGTYPLHRTGGNFAAEKRPCKERNNAEGHGGYITAPGSDISSPWSGHKTTALKPAWEPVLCFKRPLDGTYAECTMKYGSGALNVDAARIRTDETLHAGSGGLWSHIRDGKPYQGNGRDEEASAGRRYTDKGSTNFAATPGPRGGDLKGRYPANLILDPESVALLDAQSGELTSGKADILNRHSDKFRNTYSTFSGEPVEGSTYGDSGGASRFFYCAKASSSERNAGLYCFDEQTVSDGRQKAIDNPYQRGKSLRRNTHPTVKPIDLCRYLATLILPPASVGTRRLLVPFSGSGSEIIGALRAGWDHVTAIEQEGQYIQIAVERVINDAPLFNTPSPEVTT